MPLKYVFKPLAVGRALCDMGFCKFKHVSTVRLLMCQEHCCGVASLCGTPQQSLLTCCPGLPCSAVSHGSGSDPGDPCVVAQLCLSHDT